MQMDTAGHTHAVCGAQKAAVPEDQRWRDQAVAQQVLVAVNIGKDAVENIRALGDALFDLAPFVRRDQHRQHVQIPGALLALRVGVNVVGHAVFADLPVHCGKPFAHPMRIGALQLLKQA